MKLIACVDLNWAIGYKGDLLFHIPEDLALFKELTYGHVIVYGSNTLKTFPNGKPLSGRVNVMLSTKAFGMDNLIVANNIEELHSALQCFNDEEIFVVGGESVYTQLLPWCTEAYITTVLSRAQHADAYCPNLDSDPEWTLIAHASKHDDKYNYFFCRYVRTS